MVDFGGIVSRMVEMLEGRDRSTVKGLVELGGVVEAEFVVIQYGVLAGKEFEEVLEIEDRFEVERLVEVEDSLV